MASERQAVVCSSLAGWFWCRGCSRVGSADTGSSALVQTSCLNKAGLISHPLQLLVVAALVPAQLLVQPAPSVLVGQKVLQGGRRPDGQTRRTTAAASLTDHRPETSTSSSHLFVTPNVMSGTAGPRGASSRPGAGPRVLVPACWARYWLSSFDVTRPHFTASRFRDTKSGGGGG